MDAQQKFAQRVIFLYKMGILKVGGISLITGNDGWLSFCFSLCRVFPK